jgi:hypothetical protein
VHDSNDDYKVGYGKPPRKGQFTKGHSGNPKGRPKGSRNIATMFNKITRELINVKENGRTKTMTRVEAVLHQITNRALSGDPRTMREFIQLTRIFEEAEQLEDTSPVPHEREAAVFQNILARMRRMTRADLDRAVFLKVTWDSAQEIGL